MALALVYLFAAAKPISVRRLAALFVLTVFLATPVLGILHVRSIQSHALGIAALLSLIAWIIPPSQVLRNAIGRRALTSDSFRHVSESILWSYLVALGGASAIAASVTIHGTRNLTLGELVRLLSAVCGIALIVRIVRSLWPRNRGCRQSEPRP
jgi:hypothetical protein